MYLRWLGWFCVSVWLSGCAEFSDNESFGRITGAVVGGVIGSLFGHGSGRAAAVQGAALIGSYVGWEMGRNFDRQTRHRIYNSLDEVPVSHSRSWSSEDGHRYTITPVKTYHHQGRVCRRFKMSVLEGDRLETIKGRACRERVGHWQFYD